MSNIVRVLVILNIAVLFSVGALADMPKELKGSWILDAAASEGRMRTSPKWKPEDAKSLPAIMKEASQILYEFEDNAITVLVRGKKQVIPVVLKDSNKRRFVFTGAFRDKPVTMTVSFVKDATISIRSSGAPGMEYYLWKRGRLVGNHAIAKGGITTEQVAIAKGGITADQVAAYQNAMSNLLVGEIVVAGVIVDEAQTLLEDVDIDITVSALNTSKEEESHSSTGRFQYRWTNCMSAELYFRKEGYLGQTVEYVIHNSGASDPGSTGPIVKQTNLVVTMRSTGEPLLVMDGWLEASDTSEIGRKALVAKMDVRRGKLVKTDSKSPEKLTDALWLTRMSQNQGVSSHSKNATVGFKLEGSNGIQYRAITAGRSSSSVKFEDMVKAPTGGYANALILDDIEHEQYFYFRIGSNYGKGRVGPVASRGGGVDMKLWAPVRLQVQTNGTRDLFSPYTDY